MALVAKIKCEPPLSPVKERKFILEKGWFVINRFQGKWVMYGKNDKWKPLIRQTAEEVKPKETIRFSVADKTIAISRSRQTEITDRLEKIVTHWEGFSANDEMIRYHCNIFAKSLIPIEQEFALNWIFNNLL